ncbi:MAG: AAA family ATPase [Rhodospirillales bacterium]|nr:MAG: AAA family ATPase [Rhodospirillales bacterium]
MATLVAMCGLAFSGKSTIARLLADALDAPRISLDAINEERGLDGGAGIPDAEWEATSRIAVTRLRAALAAGRHAVLDDTLSHRFLRDRYRAVAAEAGAAFALVFVDTPLDEIRRRRRLNDAERGRPTIADTVFDHHAARFERPADDEIAIRIAGAADIDSLLANPSRALVAR